MEDSAKRSEVSAQSFNRRKARGELVVSTLVSLSLASSAAMMPTNAPNPLQALQSMEALAGSNVQMPHLSQVILTLIS